MSKESTTTVKKCSVPIWELYKKEFSSQEQFWPEFGNEKVLINFLRLDESFQRFPNGARG